MCYINHSFFSSLFYVRLHSHVYTQKSPSHVWVSAFLWISRPLCGSWTSLTCFPLPNGHFPSLVHHPWASTCQSHTTFILHGNLAQHHCLVPLAIILLCWAFSKIVCVNFMGLLGAIYHPCSNCKRDLPCSICKRASSTYTPFPLQLRNEPQ